MWFSSICNNEGCFVALPKPWDTLEGDNRGYCPKHKLVLYPKEMVQMHDFKVGVWDFKTKDGGARETFTSGMQRDTAEGKIDYSLALDGPLFKRYAALMNRGAVKYEKRNWMKAAGEPELERFRESALRHFLQWYWGETDEDHAAAVVFNLNGAEYTKEQLVVKNTKETK